MPTHILVFVVAFVLGGGVALVIRSAVREPYAASRTEHAVSAPAATPTIEAPAATSVVPVNTVCPICAMTVDPTIPTAVYQGHSVAFGCRMCPPLFDAQPELYGPAALENRVVE